MTIKVLRPKNRNHWTKVCDIYDKFYTKYLLQKYILKNNEKF